MKKLKDLSLKKVLIISISIAAIIFLIVTLILTKILNSIVAVCIGFVIAFIVEFIISECICEYSIRSFKEKIKKKFEKKLKYDGYTEVHLITNEFIDIALEENKVKYYAKLMKNDQIVIMVYKNSEVVYKNLEFYQFEEIFSI